VGLHALNALVNTIRMALFALAVSLEVQQLMLVVDALAALDISAHFATHARRVTTGTVCLVAAVV
jgi:hypothetical protein